MVSTSPSIRARSGSDSFARLHLISVGLEGAEARTGRGQARLSLHDTSTCVPRGPRPCHRPLPTAASFFPFKVICRQSCQALLMNGPLSRAAGSRGAGVIAPPGNCIHQSGWAELQGGKDNLPGGGRAFASAVRD